jgi:hypothetical protein
VQRKKIRITMAMEKISPQRVKVMNEDNLLAVLTMRKINFSPWWEHSHKYMCNLDITVIIARLRFVC